MLGAVYGLMFRIASEYASPDYFLFHFDIYSISFIWILPICIGIIPIIFAQDEMLQSDYKQFFYPLFSVLLFLLLAFSTGLEDWLCLLILGFPYLMVAGAAGLIIGTVIEKINARKLYSILLLPFIIMPIENQFSNQKEVF